eukprot:gene7820-1019_t
MARFLWPNVASTQTRGTQTDAHPTHAQQTLLPASSQLYLTPVRSTQSSARSLRGLLAQLLIPIHTQLLIPKFALPSNNCRNCLEISFALMQQTIKAQLHAASQQLSTLRSRQYRQPSSAMLRSCTVRTQSIGVGHRIASCSGRNADRTVARASAEETQIEDDDDDESAGGARKGYVLFKQDMFVEIGRVMGVHGVKGELKIGLETDSPAKRFGKAGKRLYLRPPRKSGLIKTQGFNDEMMKVKPLSGDREAWLVKFAEVKDRTEAEDFKGYSVFLALSDRERLSDPDEFYARDLDGCKVFLKDRTVAEDSKGHSVFLVLSVRERLSDSDEFYARDLDGCKVFLKYRTEAEDSKGFSVFLALSDRERLSNSDEFYARDLDGCKVYLKDTGAHVGDVVDMDSGFGTHDALKLWLTAQVDTGAYVGDVVDVNSGFGTHDTLKLRLRPTMEDVREYRIRTCFIPFVKQMVPVVYKKTKTIIIDPPEGLLELAAAKKLNKGLLEVAPAKKLNKFCLAAGCHLEIIMNPPKGLLDLAAAKKLNKASRTDEQKAEQVERVKQYDREDAEALAAIQEKRSQSQDKSQSSDGDEDEDEADMGDAKPKPTRTAGTRRVGPSGRVFRLKKRTSVEPESVSSGGEQ